MKKMPARKVLSGMLVALLVLAAPVRALAQEYNLVDGNISINARDDGQYVSQEKEDGVTNARDDAPVIYSSETTQNSITISSEGDNTAKVTIENVTIENTTTGTGESQKGIDVTDNSKAEITVSGDNSITVDSSGGAAVHVGNQSQVTITSSNGGKLDATSGGTGIGSYTGDEYTGSVTFGGNVDVSAQGGMGASIGSGYYADASGNVTVQENAKVNAAESTAYFPSAGLGTGAFGENSLTVTVKGNAQLDAQGGIGSGFRGNVSDDAEVVILDSASVNGENEIGKLTISETATLNGISGSEMDPEEVTIVKPTEPDPEPSPEPDPEPTPEPDPDDGKTEPTVPGGDQEEKPGTEVTPEGDKEQKPSEAPAPEAPVSQEPEAASTGTKWTNRDSLYWVTKADGSYLRSEAAVEGGVLTVTADASAAILNAKAYGLQTLQGQGIQTIVFVTEGATSTFSVEAVLTHLTSGLLALSHDGSTAALSLAGEAHDELLK